MVVCLVGDNWDKDLKVKVGKGSYLGKVELPHTAVSSLPQQKLIMCRPIPDGHQI